MRELFLTLYPEPAASPRYRVMQYLPYLESQGIECTVQSALAEDEYRASLTGRLSPARYHFSEMRHRYAQLKACGDYDIVVLQKAISTAYIKGFDTLLRANAKRLLIDIDDAVHLHPPVTLGFPWRLLEDQGQLQKIIASADGVLAGNRWLVDEVEHLGGQGQLLPTVVDTTHYVPAQKNASTFRIGWMGNPSTAQQLLPLKAVLKATPDAEIHIVGANEETIAIENATYHTWSAEEELAHLHTFSVGLMPLTTSEWTRGKCAFKALVYMACGIPCIATPFGAVEDIIKHNQNGLFADSPDEWASALEQLRDPAEQKRLGQAARKTVEQHYALDAWAPRYAEILRATA